MKLKRRAFIQSLVGVALTSSFTPLALLAGPEKTSSPPMNGSRDFAGRERYRAVSWWLTWDDLTWPNDELMDKVRRRADHCASNAVNCCLIFGAHFRWDFLPVWERLHDLIAFIASELHQRKILLFDHHSSVLTHRPRNREEALNIWKRNRHHVPFYPSGEEAAILALNGSRLNEWRMIDVESGEPIYLPTYNAEQFCMNNPAFREAYCRYVEKLLKDTGVDGLMSDDGIFYADWRACGCAHCRRRFQREYGHQLPSVKDLGFWGNRQSEAFRDWIQMRFDTSGDFLVEVKKVLPKEFPLVTCCASSDGYAMPAFGMSYQDFIRSCNLVLLEMTGSTPSTAGTWHERIPSQLLHLGIAETHHVPCFGLGYGFFPDTGFFVWALNKFLGSDSWFSTLKGRLNATEAQLRELADDPDLVGEGYRWEKAHSALFTGSVETRTWVYFSRATRDFYGQCQGDYVSDYYGSCFALLNADQSYRVTVEVPTGGPDQFLILSSAACLSGSERDALGRFLHLGGTIIATGPSGPYDARANKVKKPWLEDYGIQCELAEPDRPGAFPPYSNLKNPIASVVCHVSHAESERDAAGWFHVSAGKGHLFWRPEAIRNQSVAAACLKLLKPASSQTPVLSGLPQSWRTRQYRDRTRLLIHALPGKIATTLHPVLQNAMNGQGIIERLDFPSLREEIVIELRHSPQSVVLHSPDLPTSRKGTKEASGAWRMDLTGIRRYFILECESADSF